MQGRAERVDIAARIGDPLVLFGRRKAERSDHCALALGLEQSRDSKIDQHRPALPGQHHVRGLHVAINRWAAEVHEDTPARRIAAARYRLQGLPARDRRGTRSLLRGYALDILHHQIVAILVVEAVADCGDSRMLQLRESIGFAREIVVCLDPLLRIDEVIDHLLDRAGPIRQPLIMGEVNHAHPAAAEQTIYPVAPLQDVARLKRTG